MTLKEILLCLLTGAIIMTLFELNDLSHKIKNLEFQHTRDSLVIDSLKAENKQGGWYEAQWSKETGD